MTELEKWHRGVVALKEEYGSLAAGLRDELRRYVGRIKALKRSLFLVSQAAGSLEICRICQGDCCNGGKNHVTVVDLLVYLSDGKEPFTPRFEREICPYLGKHGCLMAPEYRPYNCITFICERVEDGLGPVEKMGLQEKEKELRSLYDNLERLFDNSFRYGFLRSFERSLFADPGQMLRGAALDVNVGALSNGSLLN